MPIEDPDDKIWPPAPNAEYRMPELRSRPPEDTSYQTFLAGLVGGFLGVILLPLILYLWLGSLDDPGGPGFWLLAGIAAILMGGVFGALGGSIAYTLYKRRKRKG